MVAASRATLAAAERVRAGVVDPDVEELPDERFRTAEVHEPVFAIAAAECGISRARLRESFESACYIRRRFTVLDLAMRAQVPFY